MTTMTNIEGDDDKKLFFTTSDLMNSMNQTLETLADPDDAVQPKFELQRRLPDGSTRRADDREVAAADMESKFQQAAKLVEMLTPTQRLVWAEQQRRDGNTLYRKGDYVAAMDVYLTCLVAKPSSTDAVSPADQSQFMSCIFIPVMNNLAQCTLQLNMYRKTEKFVTMTLDEMEKATPSSNTQHAPTMISKLHFRRAKARRLLGSYPSSRDDLRRACLLLSEYDSSERQAIDREYALLDRAESEAEHNRKRQERAMKKALGSSASRDASSPLSRQDPGQGDSTSHKPVASAANEAQRGSLAASNSRPRRNYSTLRARRSKCEDVREEAVGTPSYWQWYLALVARIATKLLAMIGDGEGEARDTAGHGRRGKVE